MRRGEGPAAPARGHSDPRPPPRRSRLADRRPALRRGGAGRGRRPAAAVGAARRPGSARRRPLRRPAARRSQPRRPARLAFVRLVQDDLFELAQAAKGGSGRAARCVASGRRHAARRSTGLQSTARDGGLYDARINSSRPSCPGRSTAAARLLERLGAEARDPIEELLAERARVRERARARRCSASSTGSRAATSRSFAIPRRRSTRCG